MRRTSLVLTLALLVAPTIVLSSPLPEIVVQESAALKGLPSIESPRMTKLPAIGDPKTDTYEIVFEVQNAAFLNDLELNYTVVSSLGIPKAGGIIPVEMNQRLPNEPVRILASFEPFEVGDQILLGIEKDDLSRAPDPCQRFCDRCYDRAEAICTSGVQTVACSCDPRSCRFTCDWPE